MAILKRSRRRSADTDAADVGASAPGPARSPGLSGAGISVALSVAFYVLVLAADVKFDGGRHDGGKSARPPLISAMGPKNDPAQAFAPNQAEPWAPQPQAGGSADVWLARAHDCAANGEWDCVVEATSSAITLRGQTPETKALLAAAMENGGWGPAPGMASAQAASVRHAEPRFRTVSGTLHGKGYIHKHSVPILMARYAARTRVASAEQMDELYRH